MKELKICEAVISVIEVGCFQLPYQQIAVTGSPADSSQREGGGGGGLVMGGELGVDCRG